MRQPALTSLVESDLDPPVPPHHRSAKMKKILKWFLINAVGLVVLFVTAVIFAIVGPRPAVVEGTDRPEWIPEQATNIFHRSQEGFGWWKAAEFTINENDFRDYAEKRGWQLIEARNFSKVTTLALLKAKGGSFPEEDFEPIPRALVYERRAGNNGGITVVLDLDTDRAYYNASHR